MGARARTHEETLALFWAKVQKAGPTECWNWIGYRMRIRGSLWHGQFRWEGHPRLSHRVSWIIHFGPITDGQSVLHECDNPGCVNPAHLFLGTQLDNIKDCVSKKRHCWPAKIGVEPWSKLTKEQVQQIRTRYQPGVVTMAALAREFGVTRQNVRHVIKGHTWNQIPQEAT